MTGLQKSCWGNGRVTTLAGTESQADTERRLVFPGVRAKCSLPFPAHGPQSGGAGPLTVSSSLCSAKDVKHRLGSLLHKSHSCEHNAVHSKKDKGLVCQR